MSDSGGVLFGGLDMKADEPEPDTGSGFSFLTGDSATAIEQKEQELQQPSFSSGFSFLSEAPNKNDEISPTEEPDTKTTSGFNFLAAPGDNETEELSSDLTKSHDHDLLQPSSASVITPAEVKLTKVASARTVKKKKRVPKVGYERDGDNEDGDAEQVATSSVKSHQETSVAPQQQLSQHADESMSGMNGNNDELTASQPENTHATNAIAADAVEHSANDAPQVHMSTIEAGSKRKSGSAFINTLFRRKDRAQLSEGDAAVSVTAQQGSAGGGIRNFPEKLENAATAVGQLFHRSPGVKAEPADLANSVLQKQADAVMSSTPVSSDVLDEFIEASASSEEKSNHVTEVTATSVSIGMFDGLSTVSPTMTPVTGASQTKSDSQISEIVEVKPTVDICSEIKKLAGDVVASFDKQATEVVDRFQYLVCQIKSIRATLLAYERNERISHQKLCDMEAEQIRLGEIEDFESADALTHVMEALRAETEAQVIESRELRQELSHLEEEVMSLNESYSRMLDSSLRGLKNLRRQQEEEVDDYFGKLEAKAKEDNSRVAVEEDRLSLEWQHVEREEAALAEESGTIENAIATQTKEYQDNKNDMDMQLLGVSAEIRNLEKALAAKRAEEASLKEELRSVEHKINEVRKKYDRQLLRINDRTVALSAVQQECRKEEEVIRRERAAVNAANEKIDSLKRDLAEWMSAMNADLSTISDVMNSFTFGQSLPISGIINHGANAQSASPEVERLHNSYVAAEASLQEAMIQQKELKSSKTSLEAEDHDISVQIPELEAEKKAHATNKRFKEAAEVVKTIKQLTNRKEEIVNLLEDISVKVEQVSLCVNERNVSLKQIEGEIKNAEKAMDLQKLAQIHASVKSLKKVRSTLVQRYQESSGTLWKANIHLINAELSVLVEAGSVIIDKHSLSDMTINMDEDFEDSSDEDDKVAPVDGGHMMSPSNENVTFAGDENDVETEAPHDTTELSVERRSEEDADITGMDVVQTSNVELCGDSDMDHAPNGVLMEQDSAVVAAERNVSMAEAKELIQLCSSCEDKLNHAVDEEDYDEAAKLSEELDLLKERVSQMLNMLGCTKQQILEFEVSADM